MLQSDEEVQDGEDWEERIKFWKSQGIFLDRKCNPSTSSGRYFFPRGYYEVKDGIGVSAGGIPSGISCSFLEMDVLVAALILSEKFGESIVVEPDTGWLIAGSVRIHPKDTTAIMYSPTIRNEDPKTYIPDPNDFHDGIVINWGLRPFTRDHDLFASALMRQEILACELYGGPHEAQQCNS